MIGKLIIISTPIGNLGDMTTRALEALRSADVVYTEDARVTGKLLAAFDRLSLIAGNGIRPKALSAGL